MSLTSRIISSASLASLTPSQYTREGESSSTTLGSCDCSTSSRAANCTTSQRTYIHQRGEYARWPRRTDSLRERRTSEQRQYLVPFDGVQPRPRHAIGVLFGRRFQLL